MITQAQREMRRKFLCASDACSVLFGSDGFRSREDVWAEKVYGLGDDETNPAQAMGNRLEPVIIDWAREQLAPARIEDQSPEWIHPAGWMLAHPDGVLTAGTGKFEPLECKYRSLDTGWGEAGSADIPDTVAVQLYVQMLCAGAACGHVAAWLGTKFGIDPRLYRVEFDAALGQRIYDELDLFWQRYVVKRVCPPRSEAGPSLDVVKRLRRVPDTIVRVEPRFIEQFVAARDARLAAEKAEKAAQAELLLHIGAAEAATCDGYVVHNKLVQRKGYRVDDSEYRRLIVRAAE